MDSSNAARQVEEILTLQEKWYSDVITIQTPALFQRLKRVSSSTSSSSSGQMLQVKKCLSFRINCELLHPDELADLILEFEFPLDYPSESICTVKALKSGNTENVEGYKSCSTAIETYLQAFLGCECVEIAMDWISEHKETCLNDSSGSDGGGISQTDDTDDSKVECYILRYNHLLSGPEHKKEKSMLDTAKKSKLQGGLLWGTPGVVVLVPPSTEEDGKEYASDCRTIGKRPDGVEGIQLPLAGIEDAGLGGLAQQKRGGKLQELDTAALRLACGGDEDLLRRVLGVH